MSIILTTCLCKFFYYLLTQQTSSTTNNGLSQEGENRVWAVELSDWQILLKQTLTMPQWQRFFRHFHLLNCSIFVSPNRHNTTVTDWHLKLITSAQTSFAIQQFIFHLILDKFYMAFLNTYHKKMQIVRVQKGR